MTRSFAITHALSLFAGALAWSASALAQAQNVPSRVYFGEPAKRCEWASTVSLPSCTGTLIHRQVIIYAAHCKTPSKVRFSENAFFVGEIEVPVSYCEKSPDYNGVEDLQKGVDFAYCVLKDPVPHDIPIAPIIYGCELEALAKKPNVWIAGFGVHNHPTADSGAKIYAETTFEQELLDGKEFMLGGKDGSACNGDSGGPAFVQLADKSWRTMGITSCGDRSCEEGAVYTNPAIMVPWMHASMKARGFNIDVEPCFDDEGNWDPTAACGHFATELGHGAGSWKNFCSEGASYSQASATCGEPHPDAGAPQTPDPGEGDAAPVVRIASPREGQAFAFDQTINVLIRASDDGAKAPVVELRVDGVSKGTDDASPYRWTLQELGAGEHELKATATDDSGQSQSASVTVLVKAKDPAPKDPSGEGSSAEDPSGSESPDEESQPSESDDASQDDGSDDAGGLPDACMMKTTSAGPRWWLLMPLVLLRRSRRRDDASQS